MKRLMIPVIMFLFLAQLLTGCSTSRKAHSELRGLMLLDNVQLGRNRAFYSKHNMKMKNEAFRRSRRNSRYM
jgi:hypothetical protein